MIHMDWNLDIFPMSSWALSRRMIVEPYFNALMMSIKFFVGIFPLFL